MSASKRKFKSKQKTRRLVLKCGAVIFLLYAFFVATGTWVVLHSTAWLKAAQANYPAWVINPLIDVGAPIADLTDALAFTGSDAAYEYDEPAPSGHIHFAGKPQRFNAPAPADIVVLNRGEFEVGWSPSLKHPVWCAYHVKPEVKFKALPRPNFKKDREAPLCPAASAYEKTGYDRGHMVPNHAIATRYGEEAQKQTFLMSNIAPQKPILNRGIWRRLEHMIADCWTTHWGEIWVIVGAIPSNTKLKDTGIELPNAYYQIIVAQKGYEIRAMAVIIPQTPDLGERIAGYLTSIDSIEEITGLNFLPDLPSFIQSPLEAEIPTRLWPMNFNDAIKNLP